VKAGEPLVELDKINFEAEAEEDGVLEFISKGRGETANVEEDTGTIRAADGAGGQEQSRGPHPPHAPSVRADRVMPQDAKEGERHGRR
jgi:2-oxoglutarate dehydrogenase E2 component (dihydrolipoamide succinyltransferase)